MGRLLFAVFLAIPLVEIALFILIGNAIGLWLTLAGVLVSALIGSVVLRMQGVALFNDIRGTMSQGRLPARALAEAMMVAIAGVLLLTPGYFSDALGLLLLVPPVRGVIYGFLATRMQLAGPGFERRRENDPFGERRSGTIDLDDSDWRNR